MAKLDTFNDPFDFHIRTLPEPNPDIQTLRVYTNEGVITKFRNLTYDTYEVVITCPEGSHKLSARAGQYGTIKVDGMQKPRSYSFAKTPELENPNEYTFFIRLVEGGEFSGWLSEKNREGEKVLISGPMGKFGLDDSNKSMVCIAGGSGMSAINALVEQVNVKGIERDCYFFYGARTQKDLYLVDELNALADNWPGGKLFKFIPVLSEEPEDSDWDGPRGFVTQHVKEEYLDKGVFNSGDIKAFFCGPPPMIDHGVKALEEAGLSSSDIYYDKFEDARSPAPVIDNAKCVLCDECLMAKPIKNCIVEATNFKVSNGDVTSFERVRPGHTSGLYYNSLFIDETECIRCYACVDACPHEAISPVYAQVPQILRKL
ncbi:MAG: 4Fe-4S binding protein [Gammaproteobacteria bacterium]|nr:4Fe-4S binding protein [Gammaproteobacteria bacterium]